MGFKHSIIEGGSADNINNFVGAILLAIEDMRKAVADLHNACHIILAANKNWERALDYLVETNEKGRLYIKTEKLKDFIDTLIEMEIPSEVEISLPIDICIGYSDEEVVKILQASKYAVKFDNKGWANNASTHIAPLVNGCILYTGREVNTSKEGLEGPLEGAIVFLGNKYCLKKGNKLSIKEKKAGEQQNFYKLSSYKIPQDCKNNKEFITSEMVLKDILRREDILEVEDFLPSNEQTFLKAKQLSAHFTTELGKEFREALTDTKKRHDQSRQPFLKEKLQKMEIDQLTAEFKSNKLKNLLNEVKSYAELKCLIEFNSCSVPKVTNSATPKAYGNSPEGF